MALFPATEEWTPNTDGAFLDWENEEKDEDEIPLVAKRNNLRETLDDGMIEQVVDWQIVWLVERTTQPDWRFFGIISNSMLFRTDWEHQTRLLPMRSSDASTESSMILSAPACRLQVSSRGMQPGHD